MKQLIEKTIPMIILAVFIALMFVVIRASLFGQVEHEQHIYFEIVFLLLLAVGGELAVIHLKQPSVMILLVLGMLISPSMVDFSWGYLKELPLSLPDSPPDILHLDEVLSVFAQLGAIILLFKVGIHNRIEHVFTTQNIVVAASGVIFPFLAGFVYASMTGGNFAYAMFLGAALTATSVGVTVAILKEFGLVAEKFAQVIIGAAIIDDILSLLLLSFVINISGGTFSLETMALTAISAVVFLSGAVLAGRYFVEYLDRKELNQRRLLLVLVIMLFYAYVAEFIRLSAIVGAFIAGVVLNRSRHIEEINQKTFGLELLFMPMFFITLGMLIDVPSLAQFALPILAITVLAFLSKLIGCGGAAMLSKLSTKDSMLVGIGMAPRGEVALIVASLGLTAGVLDVAQYSIISAMALLTTIIIPPILNRMLKK